MKSREWGTKERRRLLTEGIRGFDAARLWNAPAKNAAGTKLAGAAEAGCVRRLRRN